MKATDAKLPDFPQKSPQVVIPIYLCTYSCLEMQHRQRAFERQMGDGGYD